MKVSTSSVKQFLILAMICLPGGIGFILPSFISSNILYAGVLMTIIMVIDYFRYKITPCRLLYYELVLSIIFILSTVVNSADLLRCIKIVYKMLGASIWMDIYLKRNPKKTLRLISGWCFFWLIINMCVSIVEPLGVHVDTAGNVTAVLGIINNMEVFWVPAFSFCLLEIEINEKPFLKRLILLVLVIFIPSYIYNCQTAEILILVLALACVLNKYKIMPGNFINSYSWLFITTLTIAFFAILHMKEGGLIHSLLVNKNTLMQRVELWRSTVSVIIQKPFLGWGVPSSDHIIEYNQWLNRSPHNMFLMITYWGGLFSLGVFLFIVIKCLKKNYNIQVYNFPFVSIVCLIAMLVYFLVEVTVSMPLFFMMLVLMYNWKLIHEKIL